MSDADADSSTANAEPDAAARPTPPSERIVSLDVLRGVALLGILVINVRVFAMPEVTLANPTAYGDFSGGNYWAWLAGHLFAEGTFITLFTVLYGAGIVLFTHNLESKGEAAVPVFVRRSLLLVGFGLLHAYLLWYGDILVAYGVCGLLVVGLRRRRPRTLATLGVVIVAVPSLLEALSGVTADPETIRGTWRPAESVIQQEVASYRGDWITQLEHRVPSALQRQTAGLISYSGWRVAGIMLLGMALYKRGVLSNERSPAFYRRLIAGCSVVGLGTILAGVAYIEAHDWAIEVALFWRQFNYWGAIVLAGAYVGLVMLYCRWRPTGLVTDALAAVGRTAFSNYILQTLLATSIFYGHGLGLFGHLERVELLGVVVAIWAIQVPLSVLWLRYFRYGPLEWLWRVLTYGQWQPIR
ncbi:DUF418 domain-containing protein [Halopiger goleimassiliensis]|uniref:DUF418 domain-containing protein n=1 Tax=Halopiger goleimassiliensis TaxID=1293048 RepID=UPI0006780872|nr:DUF418 domain-containing protein [Halopiger goleimassiliensis]